MNRSIIIIVIAIASYFISKTVINKGENGFSSGTTSTDVLNRYKDLNLRGKVALITGANSGIGYETARALGTRGVKVIVSARSSEKAEKTVKALAKAVPNGEFIPLACELSSFQSVTSAAKQVKIMKIPIHMLILNAGVMAIPEHTMTKDGFETQMHVNHLSHFLLTNLLMDVLRSSKARVVSVSSAGAALNDAAFLDDPKFEPTSYSAWSRYADTKYANILFANELNRRESDITAVSVHPGVILSTNLSRHQSLMTTMIDLFNPLLEKLFTKTIEQGAAPLVYTAIAPEVDGLGGKFFLDAHVGPYPMNCGGVHDEKVTAKFWNDSAKLVGL